MFSVCAGLLVLPDYSSDGAAFESTSGHLFFIYFFIYFRVINMTE